MTGRQIAVALGALVHDGQVLLGRRSPDKQAYPDVWDLPGGVVEDGESELDALARELEEELGVRVAVDTVSPLGRMVVRLDDRPVSITAWLVRDWQGTPANLAPEEHVAIGWFDLDDLPTMAHASVRASLADVARGAAERPSTDA